MNSHLPTLFRALSEALTALIDETQSPAVLAGAAAARDRLERDLLPRTAGGHDHLVVGIVGPNNAGKSLLFNSLVGHTLSPSEPKGGATRRLLGAANAELFRALLEEPSLAQFPLEPIEEKPGVPIIKAKENARNPASLLLVQASSMPAGLVLIDAPDFDSIQTENRLATESLLKVVDLALVVVTRHTYHNELVVSFLETWLRYGRPWALFYNEAFEDESITREHTEQLSSELGTKPAAVFAAPFDIEVQRRTQDAWLNPRELNTHESLADWLAGGERRALKQHALAASVAQLAGELEQIVQKLTAERDLAREILAIALEPALAVGHRIAGRAMPPGPFLDAFRRVSDQRIAPWRRSLRAGTRKLRLSIEGFSKRLLGGPSAMRQKPIEVASLEAQELASELGPLLEMLGERLGPSAQLWRRARQASGASAELPTRITAALAAAAERGPLRPSELVPERDLLITFETRCEELISIEFEHRSKSSGRRAGESLVQFGVDLLHTMPLAAGIGTAIATGGVGADIATLFAGSVGTAMAERFTKFLGTGVARSARQRWQNLRGKALAQRLVEHALGELAAELDDLEHQYTSATNAIEQYRTQLNRTSEVEHV